MMLHILESCYGTKRLSISLELMVALFDDVDCTIPEHQPACPAFVANMAHQQLLEDLVRDRTSVSRRMVRTRGAKALQI